MEVNPAFTSIKSIIESYDPQKGLSLGDSLAKLKDAGLVVAAPYSFDLAKRQSAASQHGGVAHPVNGDIYVPNPEAAESLRSSFAAEFERLRLSQEAAKKEASAKRMRTIAIPFDKTAVREKAKALGAKWVPDEKSWTFKTLDDANAIRRMLGIPPLSEETGEARRFSSNRGTKNPHYVLGGSVIAGDGTVHIITQVHPPRYDDSRSDWLHEVSTRPATEAESAAAKKESEVRKLRDFLSSRVGPDDERDRNAYEHETAIAQHRLDELEGGK